MLWLRGAQQKPPAALGGPRDAINPAGLGQTPGLAAKDVAVDARLEAMLIVGEGVEMEVEQALAVSLAKGVREQIPEEALLVVRMRLGKEAPQRPDRSHFGDERRARYRSRDGILHATFPRGLGSQSCDHGLFSLPWNRLVEVNWH